MKLISHTWYIDTNLFKVFNVLKNNLAFVNYYMHITTLNTLNKS